MISLNHYLTQLSYNYHLGRGKEEKRKIDASISNLQKKLKRDLGDKIHENFVFGSYKRATILPRSVDRKSDVDLMVVFNHTAYERTPLTYRGWLRKFAEKNYSRSTIKRSHPSITLRLGAIDYDLVPAKFEKRMWMEGAYYIPNESGDGWRSTNPNDVKDALVKANVRHQSTIKPVIRLLKAWNAKSNYPYDSYKLELAITRMFFWHTTVADNFYQAVNQLTPTWRDAQSKKTKIKSLKKNIATAQNYLRAGNRERAVNWLHRSLPRPK